MPDVGLILLAAGGSSRMGRPKQLLTIDGETLIRRAASQAIASRCQPAVIVLGEEDRRIDAELSDLPLHIVRNDQWRAGMGGSIRRGMEAIPLACPAVVIMLCDQPRVTAAVIDRLIDAHRESGKPMCAACYAGTIGPPCLFAAPLFPKLRSLPADTGAKRLLTASPEDLATIDFPDGAIDVDTPADYEAAARPAPRKET